MQSIKYGYDIIGAKMIEKIMSEYTDLDYSNICHSTISKYVAKGVTQEFDHDEDGWEMHNADKINRSDIGD